MAQRLIGNRYQLDQVLGRGGMGEVWAGRDTRLDREVAVKLMRPALFPDRADRDLLARRFTREAQLTARLDHPGVPAVYDSGADGDDLYLVLQRVHGADLADFQAENEPVPVDWVIAIGAQVTAVLMAAHAMAMVHRDLKPRNVMVTNEGQVKVLDFGIAALLKAEVTKLTNTGQSLGTPAYMAPEQAMHGISSPRGDLYSLGCVLYELITGDEVFRADTPLRLMHRHFHEQPIAVAELRPETPAELDRLVARLLAKEPLDRPDASEVRELLISMLPAPDPTARPVPMDPTRPLRDRLAVWRGSAAPLTTELPSRRVDTRVQPVGGQDRPAEPGFSVLSHPPMSQPSRSQPPSAYPPVPIGPQPSSRDGFVLMNLAVTILFFILSIAIGDEPRDPQTGSQVAGGITLFVVFAVLAWWRRRRWTTWSRAVGHRPAPAGRWPSPWPERILFWSALAWFVLPTVSLLGSTPLVRVASLGWVLAGLVLFQAWWARQRRLALTAPVAG